MANNSSTRNGSINQFQLFQAKDNGESVDFSSAAPDIRYYESVLSNSISLTSTIVETGFSDKNLNGKQPSGIIDSLPIRGGEQCFIEIEDNQPQKNKLKFKNDNSFYVNRVRDIDPGTQKDLYFIDFCTREFIANEQSRVVSRYNGNISENVSKILKDNLGLKTQKDVDFDETAIPYNFIGNYRKPFYVCTWLASKSVPSLGNSSGGTAGYLFYETYDGFKFKSIDKLFEQNPVKKYLYTNSADILPGYDDKILNYTIERDIDLQQNLTLGTYSNRSIFFDFYNMNYKVRNFNVDENQKEKIKNAGSEDITYVADEFRTPISRMMNHILDVGTLPNGKNVKSQLKDWKNRPGDATFDATNTMVQSIMRYNQMFTIKINIIIAGDFSLRAGDLIHCDFPELSTDINAGMNKQSSGIYMIASLCHRITTSDTFTSLTLVRDTFGRKPF
jgi:hypothetical protein